jgi:hypothetical protein
MFKMGMCVVPRSAGPDREMRLKSGRNWLNVRCTLYNIRTVYCTNTNQCFRNFNRKPPILPNCAWALLDRYLRTIGLCTEWPEGAEGVRRGNCWGHYALCVPRWQFVVICVQNWGFPDPKILQCAAVFNGLKTKPITETCAVKGCFEQPWCHLQMII